MVELPPYKDFLGYTLEDQFQAVKQMKETRIPAGRYRLVLNKNVDLNADNLTTRYRKRYPQWFKYHIMLLGVPGFTGIYIHIGNKDDDTDGCLLLGDRSDNLALKRENPLTESTPAFHRFYMKYYPLLDQDVMVYLTIEDEKI